MYSVISAVPARLLHISDLHVGTVEAPDVERSLATLVERTAPQLIVASGDLTHRGRREQHERAASLLRALGPPLFVIPGNHDIAYTFPHRFTQPFAEFLRQWETTEPVYRSELLHVVGLNSVRPWRHQSGGLRQSQLDVDAVEQRAQRCLDLGVLACTRVEIGYMQDARKHRRSRLYSE